MTEFSSYVCNWKLSSIPELFGNEVCDRSPFWFYKFPESKLIAAKMDLVLKLTLDGLSSYQALSKEEKDFISDSVTEIGKLYVLDLSRKVNITNHNKFSDNFSFYPVDASEDEDDEDDDGDSVSCWENGYRVVRPRNRIKKVENYLVFSSPEKKFYLVSSFYRKKLDYLFCLGYARYFIKSAPENMTFAGKTNVMQLIASYNKLPKISHTVLHPIPTLDTKYDISNIPKEIFKSLSDLRKKELQKTIPASSANLEGLPLSKTHVNILDSEKSVTLSSLAEGALISETLTYPIEVNIDLPETEIANVHIKRMTIQSKGNLFIYIRDTFSSSGDLSEILRDLEEVFPAFSIQLIAGNL